MLDTQSHNPFKAPENISINIVAIEHNVHNLIITELLRLLQRIHLLCSLCFDLLSKENKHNNCKYLIHSLSIAKIIIIFCPEIENIHQLLLNWLSGEELIVLHRPVNVLLYHLAKLLVLIYHLKVWVQVLICERTL